VKRTWLGVSLLALSGIAFVHAAEQESTVVPPVIRLRSRAITPTAEPAARQQIAASGGVVRGNHVLVQFDRFPDAAAREEFARAGLVVLDYVPDNAAFASLTGALSSEQLQAMSIRAIEPILPTDKLSDGIGMDKLPGLANTATGRIDLLVKYFADVPEDAAWEALQEHGAILVASVPAMRMLVVELDAEAVVTLAAEDSIRWVEAAPSSGNGESNRARTHVQADQAQALGLDSFGVIVGVFDGGHVSTTHGDLPRVTRMDSNPFDPRQHATMTAGLIGGNGSGSSGRVFRGMAPASTIYSYKFEDATAGGFLNDYVLDVMKAVLTDGVNVANNSWGISGCSGTPYGAYDGLAAFLDAVPNAVSSSQPTVVFSAGNERSGIGAGSDRSCIANDSLPFENYGTINQPKAAKNIIVVGAVDSFNNRMTEYSSWGPTADGRIKPDLVGSGQHNGTPVGSISVLDNTFGIPVGAPNQQGYRTPNFPDDPDDHFVYAWFIETSAAAAEASGCVALLIDDYRGRFAGVDPRPATVKAFLIHTALDLQSPGAWYDVGPDYASGYGLIQIEDAIQTMRAGHFVERQLNAGETRSYRLNVPLPAPVNVTLAWDDYPAAENSAIALVNDLDLIVTDPGGTRRYPWTLDPANPSATAVQTVEDHLNNVEKVSVNPGAAGDWCVTVKGTSVPLGPQKFSLVADYNLIATPDIVVDTTNVTVGEGETASFRVKLSFLPASPQTVTVARASGDIDIDVLGGSSFAFTSANWNTYQTVKLAAREDSDTTNGVTTIRCSLACQKSVDVTATEQDTGAHHPAISINDVSSSEPALGTRDVAFTVGLSRLSSAVTTVRFATRAVTATAGLDYLSNEGKLTIPANTLSATIPVTIKADKLSEPTETFAVDLSSPVNATIADRFGVGTIRDTVLFTGGFDLSPDSASVRAGENVNYVVVWTVPESEVWRDLKTIDFRLRKGNETPLWVQWDEAANTFSLCDGSGEEDSDVHCTAGEAPGSPTILETEFAQLDLAESSVIGSGPTGPTVTLNLAIRFKEALGSCNVELAASDDFGIQDAFVGASKLPVRGAREQE